ncbi:hypothetical protein N7481_007306 [Penicillium waksmanii]|uniref:uncharacterized protein n=1 Tax=Penicillium waksmanii TaxID=69791 RepID=UPI0025479D3B|nr:uncharacterized protein N7481_007306 [Penicillium waksmanii]KAJ5980008.1 hypothetical protein N7481_007306 [Penicillium waksmanii]
MAEHSDAINAIKDKLRNLEDSTSRPGNASLTAYDTPATPVQLVNPSPGGSTFSRFNELMPMPIPIAHGSTSEDLLRSRQLKALLGDYPKDMLLRREQKRKQPEEFAPRKDTLADQLALPLDTSCTAELVNIYFAVVNPRHPVLEQETFDVTDNSTDVPGAAGTKIALVLMVLTLASISQASPQVMKDGVSPGIEFARPAIQFLFRVWPSYCETDMELCQALYLAASWYNYLCRPLQAWRMIHMASTNIQHVFLQYESQEVEVSQNLVRLCWAIFLMECDILAEYHLPRSGIENVVERIPYPKCGPNPDLHVLAWLANLSARRLMNCVHFTVYNTASSDLNNCHGHILDSLLDSANANVLIGISAELNHQLYLWWDLLPQPIKPEPDDLDPDAHQGDLMLRFWACGDIIFRPFLYKVCSMPQGWIPEEALIEPAMSCINHCRKFLRLVSSLTRVPSPFTLINLHS